MKTRFRTSRRGPRGLQEGLQETAREAATKPPGFIERLREIGKRIFKGKRAEDGHLAELPESFLETAQQAAIRLDWVKVAEAATAVLAIDPQNKEAIQFKKIVAEATGAGREVTKPPPIPPREDDDPVSGNERERRIPDLSGTAPPASSPLFVICLHDDEDQQDLDLAGKLAQHLGQLSNARAINLWRTADVEPGDRTKEEIARQLELSDIVLVLLSAPFLEHYQDLLDTIDTTRAAVLPVRLRPVDYEATPFAGRKPLPPGNEPVCNWVDPDEALLTIAKVIRQKVEAKKAASVAEFPDKKAYKKSPFTALRSPKGKHVH